MLEEKKLEEENSLVHVIFEDGEFRKDLKQTLQKWKIDTAGTNYNVVAILGPQSSGKSTLLNGLFQTRFPTMASESGRYQCTKGIWLGKAEQSDTLVMDVEGTDGRERGDKEVAFEKKTSLFSLALSEVLLVNMWMNDIGRNNAANLPLLKTVFEVNLQLFAHEKRSKTLLLFVVRDHVRQTTPLEKLVDIIKQDLTTIWATISKPERYANAQLSDFFEFRFTSLPHKVLEADRFADEVRALAARFNDRKNPDSVWSREFKNVDVPADGWSLYASKIWEAIKANKDLDLPSQREMLATFRCEEISAGALANFVDSLEKGIRASLARKQPVKDFGKQGDELIKRAIAEYDETATRYQADVVERKRDKLREGLFKELKDAWVTNVALLFEAASKSFETAFAQALGKEKGNKSVDFGAVARSVKGDHLKAFESELRGTLPEDANWSFGLYLEQLDTTFDGVIAHQKALKLKETIEETGQAIEKYASALEDILEIGSRRMWTDVRELYNKVRKEKIADDLGGRLATFNLTPEEVAQHLDDMHAKLLASTRKMVEQQADRIPRRMERAFELAFRFEQPSGVPRVWKPGVNVEQLFREGSAAAEAVLELYAVLRLKESDDELKVLDGGQLAAAPIPGDKTVLSRSKVSAILENFQGFAKAACGEAQHAIEYYGKETKIPTWMFVLLIIVGYNEFMAIISNPFLLMLAITLGTAAVAIHTLGLTPVVLPMVKAAYDQVYSQGMEFVNRAFAQQQGGAPGGGSGGGGGGGGGNNSTSKNSSSSSSSSGSTRLKKE